MSALDPANTTWGDLVSESLRECSAFGIGQTPTSDDLNGALVRLMWMLQEWERKRWFVYHDVLYVKVSTGAQKYTVGPGADFDTGVNSVRPNRIEAAFLRQPTTGGGGGIPVDYPLELIQSYEDYMRVTLKQLTSFTGGVFYDSKWPLGELYPVPIPQANVYSLGILVLEQLPLSSVTNASARVILPYEYYYCMMTNLAMRLRPKYGIGTWPGDPLPGLAKESLALLRGANSQIPRLTMPKELSRGGIYNIFSDRNY